MRSSKIQITPIPKYIFLDSIIKRRLGNLKTVEYLASNILISACCFPMALEKCLPTSYFNFKNQILYIRQIFPSKFLSPFSHTLCSAGNFHSCLTHTHTHKTHQNQQACTQTQTQVLLCRYFVDVISIYNQLTLSKVDYTG